MLYWIFLILFFLIGMVSSILLFFALKRINQYEILLVEFDGIIKFASKKMKLVDADGHYESDDETGFFFKELKTIQELLDGIFERISIARLHKGTRCSFPTFMRLAGTVQTFFSRLISDHFASITSLVRAAVKIRNSKAKAEYPFRCRSSCKKIPMLL